MTNVKFLCLVMNSELQKYTDLLYEYALYYKTKFDSAFGRLKLHQQSIVECKIYQSFFLMNSNLDKNTFYKIESDYKSKIQKELDSYKNNSNSLILNLKLSESIENLNNDCNNYILEYKSADTLEYKSDKFDKSADTLEYKSTDTLEYKSDKSDKSTDTIISEFISQFIKNKKQYNCNIINNESTETNSLQSAQSKNCIPIDYNLLQIPDKNDLLNLIKGEFLYLHLEEFLEYTNPVINSDPTVHSYSNVIESVLNKKELINIETYICKLKKSEPYKPDIYYSYLESTFKNNNKFLYLYISNLDSESYIIAICNLSYSLIMEINFLINLYKNISKN